MRPIDPDAISAAAMNCPSVAGLYGGMVGEVATYLPNRRVPGVRITPNGVEVHVITRWGASIPEAAEEVRAAVRGVVGDEPVSIYVDDIEAPETGP